MRSTRILLLIGLLIAPALGADDATSAESDEEVIGRLINQLSADRFDQRDIATHQLIVMGKPAIRPLMLAAQQKDPETSWRAVLVLTEIALSQQVEAVDAAEEALAALSTSTNGVASDRAKEAIESLAPMREARAIAALNHLGAKITPEDSSVLFDDAWKGGDIGLKHLARLSELRQISIEPTAPISEAAVEKLRQDLPDVRILKFGEAFLGVGTAPVDNGPGLTVLTVVPDGAAEKAGLDVQDVIYHVDGKAVDEFDDLVKILARKHAGDQIVIDYFSAQTSQRKRVKTTLGARPGVKE